MVEIDLSKVKQKKPKVAVSLSLDKANVEFLKKYIEKHFEHMTLSSVFDDFLEGMVESIKKSDEEKEKSKKEGDKDEV